MTIVDSPARWRWCGHCTGCRRRCTCRPFTAAFTLIELLICVAIIASVYSALATRSGREAVTAADF